MHCRHRPLGYVADLFAPRFKQKIRSIIVSFIFPIILIEYHRLDRFEYTVMPAFVNLLHWLSSDRLCKLRFDKNTVIIKKYMTIRHMRLRRQILHFYLRCPLHFLAFAYVVFGVEVLPNHDFIIIFIVQEDDPLSVQITYNQYHRISMFDQSTRLCDIKYKIVFLGHSAVGKSALIERFIHNNFDYGRNETVGIDFLVKNITFKEAVYRLQLWDTAGQQKFKSLVPNYIRDAHCAVFVYDTTRAQTFEGVDSWVQLFNQHHSGEAVSILVGNKTDLEEQRIVTSSQGALKASQLGINFCESSACTGRGVQQLFHSIIQNIQVKTKNIFSPADTQCQNTGSTFSSGLNKSKVVKISQQKTQAACCYI